MSGQLHCDGNGWQDLGQQVKWLLVPMKDSISPSPLPSGAST
jgi:hypothetical protein